MSAANLIAFTAIAVLAPTGWWRSPGWPTVTGFAVTFAVIGWLRVPLNFSAERADFTLTDAVMVLGFFYLGAPWLGLAAGAGELARCVAIRAPAIKAGFNTTTHAATAAVAGVVFMSLGGGRSPGPGSWLPTVAAVVGASVLNSASVSAVISRAQRTPFQRTLRNSVPTAFATTCFAAPVGLLGAELLHLGSVYCLLAVPVGAGLWFNNRDTTRQRDEHLRVERLYEATSHTFGIKSGTDVVSVIAAEAQSLVTGVAAICCVQHGSDPWSGVLALPERTREARRADVLALLDLELPEGRCASLEVPDLFRALLPDADQMVIARSPAGSPVNLVLAAFPKGGDGRSTPTGLADTLAAFATHAASIAANAALLEELQTSLSSELEANRRKDEFVATISHELRTPLTVLLGAAQTLQRLDGRIAEDNRTSLLRTAVDQGQRLKVLIDDLLLVAAAEQGNFTCERANISTVDLSVDLNDDLSAALKSRVAIQNLAPEAELLSDEYRLRQILTNLTENAGKYAPDSAIEIVISAAEAAVHVTVVDHGPGIPEEDRVRAFERFVQLDQSSTRSHGGTGLGLFICKKLATQLQASLELRTTEGGGCTFDLRLPRQLSRRSGDPAVSVLPPVVAPRGLLRRPLTVPEPASSLA